MRRCTLGVGVVLAWMVFLAGATAQAAVIVQGAGATFVAFEAEGNGVISGPADTTWHEISDPNADNGAALEAWGDYYGTATYQIQFSNTSTRTYYLYAHVRAALGDGHGHQDETLTHHDAFGVSQSLDPAESALYPSQLTKATGSDYAWVLRSHDGAADTYSASANSLGTLVASVKDGGLVIDRFVLSIYDVLGDAQLSSLSNSAVLVPEPGGAAVGLLLLGSQLRRRGRA